MPAPFSGGCTCGAIRYECSTEPVVSWQCHCRDCQHASGSAFSAILYVPICYSFCKKFALRWRRRRGGLELSAPDLRKGWVANYKQETTRARVSGSVLSTPTA